MTLEEFRRLPLPASEIIFENGVEGEPMYGIALIGHHVNLWADSEEFETTTSILGAPVDVKATPIEYRWTYDDGQYRTTPHAGEPRPDGVDPYEYKTHTSIVYEEAGNYDVALETVYAGYFRTGGSGWIPIPGVAVVASDPKVNSIWKTETRLVSEDCTENPDGWACESPFLKTPPWEQG
ncbi:hypothetical protein [Zhihengliuella salsuginis]|uniref:hypothetical protein n=1 Tax=Zhihengliuella salsuginis TaxID=578222 RepID=UPI001673739E|nr:hypothetical protein [Zhihengliuella salsuginis]